MSIPPENIGYLLSLVVERLKEDGMEDAVALLSSAEHTLQCAGTDGWESVHIIWNVNLLVDPKEY